MASRPAGKSQGTPQGVMRSAWHTHSPAQAGRGSAFSGGKSVSRGQSGGSTHLGQEPAGLRSQLFLGRPLRLVLGNAPASSRFHPWACCGEEGLMELSRLDGYPEILQPRRCWGQEQSFLGLRDWCSTSKPPPVSSSDSSAFSWSPRLSWPQEVTWAVLSPVFIGKDKVQICLGSQLEAKPDLWAPSQ